MTETITRGQKLSGICRVCALGADCELARKADRAVIQCGQFESFPMPIGHSVSQPSKARAEAIPQAQVSNEALGLCRTCTKFTSCTFPKSEGGVWHCNEYE